VLGTSLSRLAILTIAVFGVVSIGWVQTPTSAAASTTVAAPGLIGTISGSHPRVLGSTASFAALSATVQSDAGAKGLYDRVVSKSNTLLSQAPVTYDPSNLYNTSQTILDITTTLSIAYRLTGNSDFANRLWTELSLVAAYPDWVSAGFLTTGSLTEAMGIGYDAIFDWLGPTQRQTLSSAIIDKGLSPSISQYQQSAVWTTEIGNFNVVANSGIGIGAIAVADVDGSVASSALDGAMASLQNGLNGFSPDGGYREGVQYWGYAIQHLVTFALALRISTGSDQGIFSSPGINQTGKTAAYLTGPSGIPFNYSDSKSASIDTPALFALGSEFNDSVLNKIAYDTTQLGNINQFALLWYKAGVSRQSPSQAALPLDKYYSSSGVVTMRSAWDQPDALFMGFKSANPTSNWHPQLDAGTFSLDALGVNWATELGPDDYNLPGYFDGLPNGQRWSYYRVRAEGSNTLVANPGAGPDQDPFVSSNISKVQSSADKAVAVAYLNGSISTSATTWKRGVALVDNRQQAVVQDEIVGVDKLDLWWGMHTDASIAIAADGRSAVLTKDGKQLLARIASPASVTFTQTPAQPLWSSPSPAGQAASGSTKKLAIHIEGAKSTTISVQFTPMRPGVPVPGLQSVTTLNTWSATTASAPLSTLSVGGAAVTGFTPATLTYDAAVPVGAAVPQVQATAPSGSSVAITQATSVPGRATVTVTRGSASSTYSVFLGTGTIPVAYATSSVSQAAAKATIDNDMVTKWIGAGNQTLQYQFADLQPLSQIKIKWASTSVTPTKFGVLVSSDKVTWKTIYSGLVPGNTNWNAVSFPTVNTKYVGILVDAQNVATRFTGIHEVKFYPQPDVAGVSPAQTQPGAVALSPLSAMRVGDVAQTNYAVTGVGGAPVDPSTLSIKYSSGNQAIATVNGTGQITAKAAGTTRIGIQIISAGRTTVTGGVDVTVSNPWTTTLNPTADTYVNNAAGASDTNYGTSQGLFVKRHSQFTNLNREAYMVFDLSAYSGKQVLSAKLSFTANTTDTGGTQTHVDVHSVQATWNEQTVTYNSKPPLGPTLGSAVVDTTVTAYEIDVTAYVAQQANAGAPGNFGFTQDLSPGETAGLLVLVYGKDTPKKPTLTIQTAYEPL
jgi:hypothetical protein